MKHFAICGEAPGMAECSLMRRPASSPPYLHFFISLGVSTAPVSQFSGRKYIMWWFECVWGKLLYPPLLSAFRSVKMYLSCMFPKSNLPLSFTAVRFYSKLFLLFFKILPSPRESWPSLLLPWRAVAAWQPSPSRSCRSTTLTTQPMFWSWCLSRPAMAGWPVSTATVLSADSSWRSCHGNRFSTSTTARRGQRTGRCCRSTTATATRIFCSESKYTTR